MIPIMIPIARPPPVVKGDKGILNQCFLTMSQLIGLDLIELWTKGLNGLVLQHSYKADLVNCGNIRNPMNDDESKGLCEFALASPNNFYSKVATSSLAGEARFNSSIGFHLPRDNTNTDVFIVGYSLFNNEFTGAKMNMLYWLSHSVCAIAFTSQMKEVQRQVKSEENKRSSSPTSSSRRREALVALQASGTSSVFDDDGEDEKDVDGKRAQSTHYTRQINVPLEVPPQPPTPPLEEGSISSSAASSDRGEGPTPTLKPLAMIENRSFPRVGSIGIGSITQASRLTCVASIGVVDRNFPSPRLEHQTSNDERSVCSSVGNQTMGSALTSVTGVSKFKPTKLARPTKFFDYNIVNLPLLRDIDRRVDLNEMISLEYVTGGSHSQVYSATWMGQSVIVKILSEQKANHSVAIHEFDVECELLTRLNHPNIASILGGGVIPRPFIIMERLRDVAGLLNLAAQETNTVIFKHKIFKFQEVLQLAKDLAVALRYLHADVHRDAMILHRDLKPENLGLDPHGRLKLFDFGLCRCVLKRSTETQLYEMTGNTGSLRYMAPEVVLGKPYTEKVDVYSFAMIMWTFAKSKSPFKGFDRAMHRARVVINGERPKMDPDWPPNFISLLELCWHQEDAQRPNFAEITILLDAMIDGYKDTSVGGAKSKGLSFLKTMFTKR